MSHRESLVRDVVAPIKIAHGGKQLGLTEYLALPTSKRSNDEAAVVDTLFTPRLLQWLGYSDGDWIYNRTGEENRDRPDFRVAPNGTSAFIVEDKNTAEDLDLSSKQVGQMRRYTAGTTGYAVWTNARRVVALRFRPRGSYEIVAEFSVENAVAGEGSDAGVALFHLLFRRQRYVELPEILDRIAVPEEDWERVAISAPNAREEFINIAKSVLTEISTAARAQVEQADVDLRRSLREAKLLGKELQRVTRKFVGSLIKISDAQRAELEERLIDLVADPTTLDSRQLEIGKPDHLAAADGKRWDQWVDHVRARVVGFRDQELPRSRLRRIATAYEVWKERYRIIEDDETDEGVRQHAYAEQVAYTFFIRLLLARILEDRGILPRLISDGGLRDWRLFLTSHFDTKMRPAEPGALMPDALLALLYRSVSRYYRHFFSQPVFDWFEPDDYLLAVALDKLSQYDFCEIQEDILGYTYEAYIDEVARARKGHFLTPPDVVDFMLDQCGYSGKEIIGKRVIDTAVGSGSFLVHAARRLRKAIAESVSSAKGTTKHRREVAKTYIRNVQNDLVGLEINPFSCYLSELNLFIQVLDDLVFLWRDCKDFVEVDRFQIYNTNSLELPRSVLFKQKQIEDEYRLDEGWDIKVADEGRFDFVVGNPPYINRGVITDAPAYGDIPFYEDVLSGDENTYLLFLKLATYYSAPGGVISQIIPINILGDASSRSFRRLFTTGGISVEAITRFYRREILFDGVLQRVCVLTARNAPAPKAAKVRVSGGKEVPEAQRSEVAVQLASVVDATPDHINTLWSKSWLVVPDEVHYDVWEHIRRSTAMDVGQWTRDRVKFQQGDVNKTRTKVFRTEEETEAAIAITCAQNVTNFGPWERDVWLDPSIDPKRRKLKEKALQDAMREREERILRVASLKYTEWVFGLKDVVGMEPIRPLRGAMWSRSKERPFLLDHTLQIAYPLREKDNEAVQAAFGLLVSAVPGYILQLFSTNAHATRDEILRTPMPQITPALEKGLAARARETQRAGEELHALLAKWGGELRLAEIVLDPETVLERSRLPTMTLDDACRRGQVARPEHDGWRVDRLAGAGELVASGAAPFVRAVKLILEASRRPFSEARHVRLPTPAVAERFLDSLEEVRRESTQAYEGLLDERARLDEVVFSLYEIRKESWQHAIMWGVPWAVEGREEMAKLAPRVLKGTARAKRSDTKSEAAARPSPRKGESTAR